MMLTIKSLFSFKYIIKMMLNVERLREKLMEALISH